MADERKCYAGDLSSDAIGKTIRITYPHGRITSTVEDVLTEVRHHVVKVDSVVRMLPAVTKTTLFFKFTTWTEGYLLSTREVGLTVDDTLEVTVLP